MENRFKFAVVVLLLLSLMTIFISPAADLQPTALRSLQLANLLFAVLALAGTAVSSQLNESINPIAITSEDDFAWVSTPNLIDLNCTRLC